MNKNTKKYAVIMLLGVVFNLGFYYIAHVFHLPAWMDCIGTSYVAVVLEPTAGLLVAFTTNFFQATFIYDISSIIYYFVSAVAALTFGILLRKGGKIIWKRLPLVLAAYVSLSTILSSLITIWRTAGIPDSGWERHLYQIALDNGIPVIFACMFGVLILKLVDACIMAVIIPMFYLITPKSMKNTQLYDPLYQPNTELTKIK